MLFVNVGFMTQSIQSEDQIEAEEIHSILGKVTFIINCVLKREEG